MSQVNKRGEKPAANPHVDREIRRQQTNHGGGVPRDYAPLVSVLPGAKPEVHPDQLRLAE